MARKSFTTKTPTKSGFDSVGVISVRRVGSAGGCGELHRRL
jgi:hypothetical protein